MILLLLEDNEIIYDGTSHEFFARQIAEKLSRNEISIFDLTYLSNDGYRSFLGIFYWLSAAPEWACFSIHAAAAFFGLLIILETAAEIIYPRELPLLLTLVTLLLPSALIFTPWILKEGPMLCGIAVVQRFSVSTRLWKIPIEALSASFFALLIMLLRPHIGAGWLMASALSHFVSFTSFTRAFITLIIAAFAIVTFSYAIEYMAPGMSDQISEVGVIGTLDRAASRTEGGSDINRTSNPIPVLSGLVLIFLEPNPTTWGSWQFAVVGLEAYAYTIMIALAWLKCRHKSAIVLSQAFVQSVLAVLILGFYLGYMFNMGLLVRQRLQVVPAIILLAAIPLRDERHQANFPRKS